MSSFVTWTVAACIALAPIACVAADDAALVERLHNAAESTSIDDPGLKPWHLKLDVQLYDFKGNASEKGTIEEWWAPGRDKRVFDMPSYRATEIRSGNSTFRTIGQPTVPYLLNESLEFVIHPVVPRKAIDESDLELKTESFGKVKLDCILLHKHGANSGSIPVGAVPTFCLDTGGVDQLRISWLDPEVLTRNGIGLFQERRVGVETSITLYRVKAISAHVEVLESKAFDPSIFTPDNGLEDRSDDPIWVTAGSTINTAIRKVAPVYPNDAKAAHISGSVMLLLTIATDGHVSDVSVVGNPDHSLAQSAMTAVEQWVYTPYLVNGVAVKVRTTFTVHYNFGSG